MFSKILIANRGEIAVRIIRACREMGVKTVAVCSEADKNALHVMLADESYCIGGPEAADSYPQEERIISTALLSGAQAVHPGYGFLSENAHFARKCRQNGLVFIGPEPENMEKLSDKAILKELMRSAGLHVIRYSGGPFLGGGAEKGGGICKGFWCRRYFMKMGLPRSKVLDSRNKKHDFSHFEPSVSFRCF